MILLFPNGLRVDTGRTGDKASEPARTFSEFRPDCRSFSEWGDDTDGAHVNTCTSNISIIVDATVTMRVPQGFHH